MSPTHSVCPWFDEQTAEAIARRTYRVIQADCHAGDVRRNLVGCTVNHVWFWKYKPACYCCRFTIIKTSAEEFCRVDGHTSRIRRVWQQGDTLHIETQNTLYRLQETSAVEFAPIQAADLLELYLANGAFFAGYLYDAAGSPHALQAFTRSGMFADSQLVGAKDGAAFFVCCYFLETEGIRFYGKEFLCRPMLLHNLSCTPLKVAWGTFCTTVLPKQQICLEPGGSAL